MQEKDKAQLIAEIELLRGKVASLESLQESHRLNENKLGASERRYRDLVNTINSGVGVYEVINDGQSGEDYIIKEFNRAALELEGLTQEQVRGKSLKAIRPNIEDYGLIPIFREVWKTGIPALYPAKVYVDEKFSNFYENRVFRLSSGEIIAVFDDVTEKENVAQRLLENKERFDLALNATQDGVFDWNLVTNEIYYSPNWKRMLGYEPDEIADDFSVWETHTHAEDVKRSWAMQQEVINRQRDRFEMEFQMKHKDGHWVDILSRAAAIFDEVGQAVRIVGIHVDISERKEHEKEKEYLQAQLLQSQKMDSIGRLAGGVAHDFNNKLSVIQGYTELSLTEIDESHHLHSNLVEILKATRHSGAITRQLLAFARKQTISPTLLDLNETVGGMLKMLRRLIGEDITLAWFPGCNLRPVKVDSSQLDQILANLVVNARDAISGVGRITIETENTELDQDFCELHPGSQPGSYVLLSVIDNGKGMNEVTRQNIFEPFYTTKEDGLGTGLGLSMVYGIVMQNQGIITVQSQPEDGTMFKIYLPGEKGTVAKPNSPEVLGAPMGGVESILLVEDEEAIMKMASVMLENLGYKVTGACLPEEALRLFDKQDGAFDMLISDVVLPQMNGRQLADRLLEKRPKLKILFMSGYTANVIAHRGVLDDGVDFIHKPFTINSMGKKVRLILDRP